jgi:hypothetical protein
MSTEQIPVIAHAIQLAVAPVFLLTGIATLLNVMATRLARVVDRARALHSSWDSMSADARRDARVELEHLERRAHLASWSINFSTTAALLVCTVIAALFADEFFAADLKWLTGILFVASMIAVIGGLFSFLREVYLATHTLFIAPPKSDRDAP